MTASLRKQAIDLSTLKKKFLETYRATGAVGDAAKKIGVCRDTIYNWRTADPQFDKDVLSALDDNTDTLRITAFQRAVMGSSKGADTLLMFLLKSRDPKTYREEYKVNHGLEDPDGKGVAFKDVMKAVYDRRKALEATATKPTKEPKKPRSKASK